MQNTKSLIGGLLLDFDARKRTHMWCFAPFMSGAFYLDETLDSALEAMDENVYRLKSGDLLEIFDNVAEGECIWHDRISLSGHWQAIAGCRLPGSQRGIAGNAWLKMFISRLPARLERSDNHVFHGYLEPNPMPGEIGPAWSVREYGKSIYKGLHLLKDGDVLSVFNSVAKAQRTWKGYIDMGRYKQQTGMGIIPIQLSHGIDYDTWSSYFMQARPARIVPA